MTLQRQVIFWIVALAVAVLMLALFRGVLLPFVAGFALAYMMDPLADRLQRIGLGRLGASLIILILFVLIFIVALMVIVPLLGQQLGEFVERLPSYVARLQQLAVEQGGPLIERLGGSKALSDMQTSVGNLISQGMAWMGTFLQGLWSGGQALLGIFSLLVVTPVVAFYMLIDWDRHGGNGRFVDSHAPPRHRAGDRARYRQGDRRFRSRSGAGLRDPRHLLCGGADDARAQFRRDDRHDLRPPELHPLCRLSHRAHPVAGRRHRAVLAGLDADRRDPRHLRLRPVRRGQYPVAEAGRRKRRAASGLAHVRASGLRFAFRLRRPASRRPAGCRHRRASPASRSSNI